MKFVLIYISLVSAVLMALAIVTVVIFTVWELIEMAIRKIFFKYK